jgi:hypothetical protein
MYAILVSKDEIRRYWWFQAMNNQKLHQAMVKVNWFLDDPEDAFSQNDLVREWESFRSANPSFPVNAGLGSK